jgi:hypothetical protein
MRLSWQWRGFIDWAGIFGLTKFCLRRFACLQWGKGALALEVRSDDMETKKYIEFLNDPETWRRSDSGTIIFAAFRGQLSGSFWGLWRDLRAACST